MTRNEIRTDGFATLPGPSGVKLAINIEVKSKYEIGNSTGIQVRLSQLLLVDDRSGTGMKNQVLVGYRVFKKIKSGWGPRKTVTENFCITSEVIRRHKCLEYVSSTTPNFPWPQNFLACLSCVELQINQYCI